MTARDPLFVAGGVTSATEARLGLAGILAAGSGGAAARPGILYGPGNPLTVSGMSTMAYSVAPGQGVVVRAASGGAYVGSNDGTLTVTTTASPPSGSRYDVIYLQFTDTELDGATSAGTIGVIQGTNSGSPTPPAVPTGAIALAQALVPSSASRTDTGVTITPVAPFTAARGGIVPFRSSTEQAAAVAYEGFLGYRLDVHKPLIYTGEWAEIQAGPAMPAEVTVAGSAVHTITATTWGSIAVTGSITNPSSVRAMMLRIQLTAWMVASGDYVRATPFTTGAVSHVATGSGLPDAVANWGEVLHLDTPSSGTAAGQQSTSVTVIVPAGGTLSVGVAALRGSATGSQQVNYPTLRLTPIRYA